MPRLTCGFAHGKCYLLNPTPMAKPLARWKTSLWEDPSGTSCFQKNIVVTTPLLLSFLLMCSFD